MIEPAAGSKDVVSFGPFSLDPRRRLLLKDGAPVVVGARTLDTLIALVARPNEAISKRELMAVVWPDVTVEEGSLRVQIAALRTEPSRTYRTPNSRPTCFTSIAWPL